MKFIRLFILIFALSSCINSRVHKDLYSKEESFNFFISLNEKFNSPIGLPIKSKEDGINFCIKNGETIFEKIDSQYVTFKLENNTLNFVLDGKPLDGEGSFELNKDLRMFDYTTIYNIENYSPQIRVVSYFEPIRNGDWKIINAKDTFRMEFKVNLDFDINCK